MDFDMGDDEMGASDDIDLEDEMDSEVDDEDVGADITDEDIENEEDPKKKIQSLAGKLSHELRSYDGDDYSDTAKYATSMMASALDGDKINDEDEQDIMGKIENALDNNGSQDEQPDEEEPLDDMENDEQMEEQNLVGNNSGINYSAYFIDNPQDILKYIKPKHENVRLHHATISSNPSNIDDLPVGKKESLKVIGRCYDEKCDALLLSGVYSEFTAHIVVSCAGGVEESYSNDLIKKCKSNDTVEYFNKPFYINATVGYNDHNRDVTSTNENFIRCGQKKISEYLLESFAKNLCLRYGLGEIEHSVLFEQFLTLIEQMDMSPKQELLMPIMESHSNNSLLNPSVLIEAFKAHEEIQKENDSFFEEEEEIEEGEEYFDGMFTEKPKAPKNKEFTSDFFGIEIGRYFGDDDAVKNSKTFDL